MIITGNLVTRSDGYTTDLEKSKAEELMPFDANDMYDAFQYATLTTGSQNKTITMVGSVSALKDITIACGTAGDGWGKLAQVSVHRVDTVASVDESYPSDTMIGKMNLNCSNILIFDKPKFTDQKLQLVIDHNVGSNRLVCVNIHYFSKNFN